MLKMHKELHENEAKEKEDSWDNFCWNLFFLSFPSWIAFSAKVMNQTWEMAASLSCSKHLHGLYDVALSFLYRCLIFWLLCGPVFNMFCWTFWFDRVEQRLRISVVSFFVLLLGYSVGITNDRWLWPKVDDLGFLWVGLANKWTLCIFLEWNTHGLKLQRIAAGFCRSKESFSFSNVCMHGNQKKIVL